LIINNFIKDTITKSHFYVGLPFNKNMKREYILIVTKINRKKERNTIDGER